MPAQSRLPIPIDDLTVPPIEPTRFGDTQVKRAIDLARELLISRDRKEHVAGFHRDLIFAEAMILEDANVVEGAFDQRLGARFAVLFQQVLFEAAGIDADADRAAVGAGRGDDFLDALFGSDVARIDAQARRAGVRGLERALVVKVDVRDDRHAGFANDGP